MQKKEKKEFKFNMEVTVENTVIVDKKDIVSPDKNGEMIRVIVDGPKQPTFIISMNNYNDMLGVVNLDSEESWSEQVCGLLSQYCLKEKARLKEARLKRKAENKK